MPLLRSRLPAKPSEKNSRFFRLDPAVTADEIDLAFELDPNAVHFSGEARYSLRFAGAAKRRKRRILLHAADLQISHVRLEIDNASFPGRVTLRPESETVSLEFDHSIGTGEATLKLAFRGAIRDDLRGLYRGGSESGNAAVPWIASQLCPTDARRLFPCFDEPGFKARYRIRMSVPAKLAAISNAPVESETAIRSGWRTVQFRTTPPLSAYLVAIAAGPFEASAVRRVGTTDLCVYTLPGRQALSAFALDAAAASLTRLEAWFDMPHPYPKLDLLALPEFAFGAMENAGAVFFRDSILLLDAKQASHEDRKRAAEVIAHELAHMWFGNLVTMEWWNDLWLNEAFATWMAYEIVHDWKPEWGLWLDFAHRREEALRADAMTSTHAIAPPIRSASEAHENFDAITYTKGACVLRMLEQYIGPSTFQKGIRDYIQKHREANAAAADLWHALAAASGEPIESIVGPWTLQEGYPLVSLKKSAQSLQLSQERFLASPRSSQKTPAAEKWPIPWLGHILPAGKRKPRSVRRLWRGKGARQPAADLRWAYGNAAESGFFRVEHAPDLESALFEHITRLEPTERIGLLGSQWALVRSGRRPIAAVLDLVAALSQETDAEVLASVESVLGRIAARLDPEEDAAAGYRRWVADRFGEAFESAGFDGGPDRSKSTDATALRRARLVAIMGHIAQEESVLQECHRRAEAFFQDQSPLPRELAGEILRIAAQRGDVKLHDHLRAATRRAHTPQLRRRSLFALAFFRTQTGIEQSLDAALDPELAPLADRAQLLGLLLQRRKTAPPTWSRLQDVWPALEQQMPPILLARLARSLGDALPAQEGPAIQSFFRTHPLAAGDRALREVREELAAAAHFERRIGAELLAYFKD